MTCKIRSKPYKYSSSSSVDLQERRSHSSLRMRGAQQHCYTYDDVADGIVYQIPSWLIIGIELMGCRHQQSYHFISFRLLSFLWSRPKTIKRHTLDRSYNCLHDAETDATNNNNNNNHNNNNSPTSIATTGRGMISSVTWQKTAVHQQSAMVILMYYHYLFAIRRINYCEWDDN